MNSKLSALSANASTQLLNPGCILPISKHSKTFSMRIYGLMCASSWLSCLQNQMSNCTWRQLFSFEVGAGLVERALSYLFVKYPYWITYFWMPRASSFSISSSLSWTRGVCPHLCSILPCVHSQNSGFMYPASSTCPMFPVLCTLWVIFSENGHSVYFSGGTCRSMIRSG
jgi:hypothetical protein